MNAARLSPGLECLRNARETLQKIINTHGASYDSGKVMGILTAAAPDGKPLPAHSPDEVAATNREVHASATSAAARMVALRRGIRSPERTIGRDPVEAGRAVLRELATVIMQSADRLRDIDDYRTCLCEIAATAEAALEGGVK